MKWQNKLTKSELKHLKESGVTTLVAAKRNAKHQSMVRSQDPDPRCEPCWECRNINIKLGIN